MSPEQATASPQVDGRADIYALGCVLYEMLVGQPPFSGPTAQTVMARHTADPAPPLHTVRDVPQALETVVLRALAKAPAERWQTGGAFAERLEEAVPLRRSVEVSSGRRKWLRMGAGAAGSIAMAALAWFVITRGRSGSVAGTETVQSVAVLPFTVVGDTARGILADGVTEGVITGLVQVEGLGVLSGSRVLAYRDRPIDPREAGRELGVSTVVSGGVQVAGNGFRVTAQLTNVGDGLVLWREQFDGDLLVRGQLQDVFSIQDAITEKIVEALRPHLGTTMQAALARGVRTRDPLAYDLYLKARRLTARVEERNFESAVGLLKQAISRDSMYADAWAALADAYAFMADWGSMPPSELVPAMRRAVDRAIALDERNGKAFAMRGYLRLVYDWDFDGAQRDIRHAVELAPASANVTVDYAWFLETTGKRDSAVAQMRRAVAIEPTNPFVLQNLALRLYHAGEVERTIRTCLQATDIDSTFSSPYWLLANAYLDTGKHDQADSAHARWRRYSSEYYPMTLALSSVYYRRAVNRPAAEATLERLLELSKQRYVSATTIGVARLAVGDRAGALHSLEEGARNNDLELVFVLTDLYGPLRGEPRFEAVRRRVFGDRPFPSTPFR
jgi:serine/threonine-protein kinase